VGALVAWAGLAAGLLGCGLVGCGEAPDPRLRERIVLVEGGAFGRLLDRAVQLEGTPIAREARGLRARLGDCPLVWGHFASDSDDDGAWPRLRCVDELDTDHALQALATTRRGDHAGWIQWPLGEQGRLELQIDFEAEGDLTLTGWIDPPEGPGTLALLLPGREAPAPPAIDPSRALVHARMRPADGIHLSSLIPAGGQADRLFALKGRLLEGALLSGTWELAFMPPAPDGGLPLAVAALHHRLEAPIRQAVDEALDQLERKWPIRRTPKQFAAAGNAVLEGGCFVELPLLPELAPCWVVTPEALLVGYRAEALEAALASPSGANAQAPPGDPQIESTKQSGVEIHFDRLREANRQISPESSRTRPSDLWSRFELRLEAAEPDRIALSAELEARS
jgi:hypothetical protein